MTTTIKSDLKKSHRSSLITQSEIRNMSIHCDEINGINLSQGICDLPLPSDVAMGAHNAINNGINYYTRYDGLLEIREAIAQKAVTYNKIPCDPLKNIIVSSGATGTFYCACMALLNPEDEVILFEPYYGYHVNTLFAVGAVPKYIRMVPPDWQFDMEDLEKVVSHKTKGIMINTPSNPCGKIFTKKELDELGEFCIQHDLFIFTDEIYEYFIYDGYHHISPGSIENIKDRVITISGYSKTFSITGWRIGYCICPEKWKEAIGYINDLIYVCAPSPLQLGVAAGILNIKKEFYKTIQDQYKILRDKLCDTLKKIHMTPYVPSGAYYILADVSSFPGKNAKEKAMNILTQTSVASVPGNAFYHDESGENLVRFCFAKDEETIDKACRNLLKLTE